MVVHFSYNGALSPLSRKEISEDKKPIWLNPQPAGADFVRPHLMSFEEETEEMVKKY
jgi:hypothetical protein